jgi:predicted Rossmann fold nucleotide-binding protein DprA/Smf involved in DNA uptake
MKKRIALAIIGGRSFTDYGIIPRMVEERFTKYGVQVHTVVSGGADGADNCGRWYALNHGMSLTEHYPDYNNHPKKQAPVIRNQWIIDDCDAVLAFWDGASPGTKNAMEKARVAGKVVEVVQYDPATQPPPREKPKRIIPDDDILKGWYGS